MIQGLIALSAGAAMAKNYFAILPMTGTMQDNFTDAILELYEVKTLWIKEFDEIEEILKQLYCYPANKGRKKKTYDEWDAVYSFEWP